MEYSRCRKISRPTERKLQGPFERQVHFNRHNRRLAHCELEGRVQPSEGYITSCEYDDDGSSTSGTIENLQRDPKESFEIVCAAVRALPPLSHNAIPKAESCYTSASGHTIQTKRGAWSGCVTHLKNLLLDVQGALASALRIVLR